MAGLCLMNEDLRMARVDGEPNRTFKQNRRSDVEVVSLHEMVILVASHLHPNSHTLSVNRSQNSWHKSTFSVIYMNLKSIGQVFRHHFRRQ